MFSRKLSPGGRRRSLHWVAFFLACLVVPHPSVQGQNQTPSETNPKAGVASFVRHGWSEKGELVLAVKITARSERLVLGSVSVEADADGEGEIVEVFSMGNGRLVDLYTEQQIAPLPRLPKKPFFGTMSGIIALEPGDSLTFGVAFPRPPDPPRDNDGNVRDYRFKLLVPKMKPVDLIIPFHRS